MRLWLTVMIVYMGASLEFKGQIPLDPDSCPGDRHRASVDVRVADKRNSPYCEDRGPLSTSGSVPKPREPSVSLTTLAAPKEARKAYERARREGRREMHKKTPDLTRVVNELEKAVVIHPSYADAWHLLGIARMALGDAAPARDALERAISFEPKFDKPYLPLINLEISTARFSEAAALADRLVRLSPGLTQAHYYHAVAHSQLGHLDTVRESVRVVLQRGEEKRFPGVHALLGDLYAADGKAGLAVADYRRLLELQPDSPLADQVRKQLEDWAASGIVK